MLRLPTDVKKGTFRVLADAFPTKPCDTERKGNRKCNIAELPKIIKVLFTDLLIKLSVGTLLDASRFARMKI